MSRYARTESSPRTKVRGIFFFGGKRYYARRSKKREVEMGIPFSSLWDAAAKEKQLKEHAQQPKDLGDALEELDLPGGMLAGRVPSRRGTAKQNEPKKDE